jgi:hypothetical protein
VRINVDVADASKPAPPAPGTPLKLIGRVESAEVHPRVTPAPELLRRSRVQTS